VVLYETAHILSLSNFWRAYLVVARRTLVVRSYYFDIIFYNDVNDDRKYKAKGVLAKKFTEKSLNPVVAKIGLKSAVTACGAASYFGTHPPKEPEALKQFRK